MEQYNRTSIGAIKRSIDTVDKVKVGIFFRVWINCHPLFMLYGDGSISYEVVTPSLTEAVDLATKLHQEEFIHNEEEECEPYTVEKLEYKRSPDETILDIWWKTIPLRYLKYWEPDTKTEELIKLLEENEGESFILRAYFINKIWEVNLE